MNIQGENMEKIFKEKSFSAVIRNNVTKINIFEIFKMISPETSVKVI